MIDQWYNRFIGIRLGFYTNRTECKKTVKLFLIAIRYLLSGRIAVEIDF